MTCEIKILFLGDIVGKAGRLVVKDYLANFLEGAKPDFIILNGENASHGFGLTEKNYNEILTWGVNCITSGNHIWDKRDIFKYIENAEALIRPINYPEGTPGVGSRIFDMGEFKIGVINVLGRTFMSPIESPWQMLKDKISEIKKITPIVFIDFHAEATAEKICMGRYCADLGASVFVGTHTHVQTADEQIYNNCCAYITDVGFCGDANGVIGMEYETSLKRLLTSLPERFEVANSQESQLNAIIATLNVETGCAIAIERINLKKCYKEVNMTTKG